VKPLDLSGMSPVPDARAAHVAFHGAPPRVEPEVWARPATWEEIPVSARRIIEHAMAEGHWRVTYARGTPDPDDLRQRCSSCGAWCRLTDAGRLYKHGRPTCGGDPIGEPAAPVASSVVVKARTGREQWVAVWEDGAFWGAWAPGIRRRTLAELRAWLSDRSLLGSRP
jgi:hypothetical protein